MQRSMKYYATPSRSQKRHISRFMRGKAHAYNFGVDFIGDTEWDKFEELDAMLKQARLEFKQQILIRSELAEFRKIKCKKKGTHQHALADSVITQAFADLREAFVNERRSSMSSHKAPKTKRINARNTSIRCQLDNRYGNKFNANGVKFSNLGLINCKQHRHFAGATAPKMATITRNNTGQYHICLSVEVPLKAPQRTEGAVVGIDLGIACRMAFDDGTSVDVKNIFKIYAPKIARFQRQQSRCRKPSGGRAGSRQYYRLQRRINRVYRKVSDIRINLANQITTRLVASNVALVCLEDLDISSMLKRGKKRYGKTQPFHTKAVNLADASLNRLAMQLMAKCEANGIAVQQVGQYYPSSKTCSGCGAMHHMPVSRRRMVCGCGTDLDRDVNAAINIKNEGIRLFNTGLGNQVLTCRVPASVGTQNSRVAGFDSAFSGFRWHGSDNKLVEVGSR